MVKGSVDNRTYRCKRTKKRKFCGNRHTRNAVVTEEGRLLVPEDNSDIDLVTNEDDVVEPSTSHTEVNNNKCSL